MVQFRKHNNGRYRKVGLLVFFEENIFFTSFETLKYDSTLKFCQTKYSDPVSWYRLLPMAA